MRTRWIQSKVDFKLRSSEEHAVHMDEVAPNKAPRVLNDIEPFVSSVSGKVVGSRSALRRHNHRHNVVSFEDWGNQGDINRKEHEKVFLAGKDGRVEDIRKAIHDNGGDY